MSQRKSARSWIVEGVPVKRSSTSTIAPGWVETTRIIESVAWRLASISAYSRSVLSFRFLFEVTGS